MNDPTQKIHILPENVANQIAAGEVIERPASVVKELVENAIDAQCSRIRIEVEAGGKMSIRVVDDGVGMSRQDVPLAFHRHATSKIRAAQDLESIGTLGFRGEALPSMAAVAEVEVVTRQSGELEGTAMKVVGGTMGEARGIGAPEGTSVAVRRLFFNTPARRKFLKTAATEFRHILDLVTNLAIAHPEVSFVLVHDRREVLNLPASPNIRERMDHIFDPSWVKDLLTVNHPRSGLTIRGFIGRPQTAAGRGANQRLFVNRRFIANRSLSHAIRHGYGELLSEGHYPVAILLLEVDPRILDVNVHPTKREVRFSQEQWVHDEVVRAIRDALTGPEAMPGSEEECLPPQRDRAHRIQEAIRGYISRTGAEQMSADFVPPKYDERPVQDRDVEPTIQFWQLHNLYILTQVKTGLLLIDQHAANERILYERSLADLKRDSATSQQLLFPQTMEFNPTEFSILNDYLLSLQRLGFGIKLFGGRTVVVDAVPSLIHKWAKGELLKEIIDALAQGEDAELEEVQRLAKSFACRGAIKAGQKLSQEEMNQLFDQLFATEEPYFCPHGRPTVIKISLEELHRRFGR